MNINELVEQVAGKTGMDEAGVKKALEAMIAAIGGAAEAGEDVARWKSRPHAS